MDGSFNDSKPGFLEGTEVARVRQRIQPGFDEQLELLKRDVELKKKLAIALLVIFAVFLGGMAIGALLGIFI
jgi:hypothetical protein